MKHGKRIYDRIDANIPGDPNDLANGLIEWGGVYYEVLYRVEAHIMHSNEWSIKGTVLAQCRRNQ